jgi:hypothetical protein
MTDLEKDIEQLGIGEDRLERTKRVAAAFLIALSQNQIKEPHKVAARLTANAGDVLASLLKDKNRRPGYSWRVIEDRV